MSIILSYKKHPSIHPSAYLFLLKTHQLAQPPPRQILGCGVLGPSEEKTEMPPKLPSFLYCRRKQQKKKKKRKKKEEEEDVPKFASLCVIKLVAIMSGDDRKIQSQKNFGMMFQSQKIDLGCLIVDSFHEWGGCIMS
jgi:hypothetical protein